MIIRIDASHDVSLVPTADDEVQVLTYTALLPYLPGIVRLHGLGRVRGRIIELAQDWPGWPADTAHRPRTAAIVTRAG